MSINPQSVNDFIKQAEKQSMSKALAEAVIERFDDAEGFLDVYREVIEDGIHTGFGDWLDYTGLTYFFEANKADIVNYISSKAKQEGFDSYVKYIAKFSILNEGDIEMAFSTPQSDNYILTVAATCHFVAEQACRDFAIMNGEVL